MKKTTCSMGAIALLLAFATAAQAKPRRGVRLPHVGAGQHRRRGEPRLHGQLRPCLDGRRVGALD